MSLALTAFAFIALSVVGVLGNVTSVNAAGAVPKDEVCKGARDAVTGACDDTTDPDVVFGWVGEITGWILWAVGAVCVIFIIWGGIRYATSGGDAEKVKKAKNTLLYALIGLAVALLAGVIVSLVTNSIGDVTS